MSAAVVSIPDGVADGDLATLLAEPAAALARGELVAFPTETVYGLGADALSARAVARVFAAKGRPPDNPLIVHLAEAGQLGEVAVPSPLALDLAARFWPGPLTLVLERRPGVPDGTTAGLDTVAVRVPASGIARALIAQAGTPVAAPSANVSGRPSPTMAAHVLADLGGVLSWVVDGGPCALGIESTVVDARGAQPVVLREGSVTREHLGRADSASASAHSPGTRHRHYTPRAAVRIAATGTGRAVAARLALRTAPVGLVAPDADLTDDAGVVVLAAPPDTAALGQVLYAALRRADDLRLPLVVVEAVADTGVGRAVMDRLRRASDGHDPAVAGSRVGAWEEPGTAGP